MVEQRSNNYLACKPIVDSLYKCYTEEKYGQSIKDAPAESKPYEQKFYNCMFREGSGMELCQNHFHDMIRTIYRSEDNKLNDRY